MKQSRIVSPLVSRLLLARSSDSCLRRTLSLGLAPVDSGSAAASAGARRETVVSARSGVALLLGAAGLSSVLALSACSVPCETLRTCGSMGTGGMESAAGARGDLEDGGADASGGAEGQQEGAGGRGGSTGGSSTGGKGSSGGAEAVGGSAGGEGGGCPAGTAGMDCEACAVGEVCEGGDEPVVACDAVGGFDDDADPATECAPWTECDASEEESAPGTATTDRECTPKEWIVQYGRAGVDLEIYGAAVDEAGDVYVAGELPVGDELFDAIVYKISGLDGSIVWAEQFGANDGATHAGVVDVSADGGILVGGSTSGSLAFANTDGSADAFVRRLRAVDGGEEWTVQRTGESGGDIASGCVTPSGVMVLFSWDGGTPVVVDVGSGGEPQISWTLSPEGRLGRVLDAACADDGHTYTAEYLLDPGFRELDTANGKETRLVRMIDALGTSGQALGGLAVGVGGRVFLAGGVSGEDELVPGQAGEGGTDAYVVAFDEGALSPSWVARFGTSEHEGATAVATHGDEVLVAGETTGTLVGVASGLPDSVYLSALGQDDGANRWTRQWSSAGESSVVKVRAGQDGSVFLVGQTTGEFADPEALKANEQLFVIKVVP